MSGFLSNALTNVDELLSYQFLGNTVHRYIFALALFIVIFIAFKIFKLVVVKNLKKLAKKTKNEFDDKLIEAVEGVNSLLYYIVALYFPAKLLISAPNVLQVVNGIFIVVVVWQVVVFVQKIGEYGIGILVRDNDGDIKKNTTHFGLNLIMKIALWSVAILLILSNLGVNITSLVASLGIGGIAVALAIQNILEDIFCSFSIYFDKPFVVGDSIKIGSDQGEVKKIGLKTTRIETLHGEELVISNKELTSARVQNFKKMKKRRVDLNLGFTYETASDKLEKVNEIVEKTIKGIKDIEFARSHFVEFGDFSLKFEVVYYILTREYDVYADRQQEINFSLKREFEKENLEMAFPTQTVYVEK